MNRPLVARETAHRAVLARLLAATVLSLLAGHAAAVPLAEPALAAGQDIRQETGEITVNAAAVTVVRYTWRDSRGDPRSVSLVPASPSTAGYAVQMSYTVIDAGNKRTAFINADPAPDGGFGYFVSHELFRDFSDGGNGTIAELHNEDDSPLGRYLASTGSAQSAGASQAAHEFRLDYPRWGTVASIPLPDAVVVSANPADHQRFLLPVVVRWHFVAGQDYPLWSVDYDLTVAGDHIASDVRGPYGAMVFNEGNGPDVTALKWGDKYLFAADAGNADFSAAALPAGGLAWNWSSLNGGRRYNALGSMAYEFGLVDTVPWSASLYGDGFSDHRGGTSALGGCSYSLMSLPCDFEWAYQSFQFDFGPPARAKLAWGSSPFLGSSTPAAYNGVDFEPISGKGHIQYGLHIVFGRSAPGLPLTLARAATPLEATPALAIAASPAQGGTLSYTVLGDPGGPYTSSGRLLPPWASVKLTAASAAGFTFSGWSGACAAVPGTTCLIAMSQSSSVTANFTATAVSSSRLVNLSTRMQVQTGNSVLIGGFVIGGTASKTVAIVATGPSLAAFGISNALANPTLTVVRSSDQSVVASNDDWQSAPNASQLQAAGFAPSHPLESAVLATLAPGAYTAIVSGVGGGTGVGLVAVYEIDSPDVPLVNISTRGQVLAGNDVMIGGFVIQGSSPQQVAIVATGPSLAAFGIANPLANPTLTLVRSSDQSVVAVNDDWQSAANASQLQAAGFAPSNPLESAILITLSPGAYTAIVSGVGGGTGVGIVAVYAVP
jgi:uncharacterized repeat protein (TIGR02543 family)